MKRVIKLTESDLHRIIAETVKSAINEIGDTDKGQYALGQASARRAKRSYDAVPSNDHDTYWENDLESARLERHANRNYEQPRTGENWPIDKFNSSAFEQGWNDYMTNN